MDEIWRDEICEAGRRNAAAAAAAAPSATDASDYGWPQSSERASCAGKAAHSFLPKVVEKVSCRGQGRKGGRAQRGALRARCCGGVRSWVPLLGTPEQP